MSTRSWAQNNMAAVDNTQYGGAGWLGETALIMSSIIDATPPHYYTKHGGSGCMRTLCHE